MTVSFLPEDIDALVFDVGGVFLVPNFERIGSHLREAGYWVPEEAYRYLRAHHRGIHALTHSGGHNEGDRMFWHGYRFAYVMELGLAEDDAERAAHLFAELFGTTVPLWTQPIQHNIDALRRLEASGRPLAIVSNNDGTAQRQLEEEGICQVGDGPLPSVAIVVDSGAIGISKPDPNIFVPALATLGTDPHRTLYVGDTVHADVRGARAAGMPVVQLDPFDDHAEFEHDRLHDLVQLAELFGV